MWPNDSSMWSSPEHTPTAVPVHIGDARWSDEFSAPHSPVQIGPSCASTVSMGSLSSSGGVDKIPEERISEEPQKKQVAVGPERGRTAGKKRAVFGALGAVGRLLSRSRSASKKVPRSDRDDRTISEDCPHGGSVNKRIISYNSEPNATRRFLYRPRAKSSMTATGRAGCVDRPPSGREENFHLAMENKLVHLAFHQYCKKSHAVENVSFVQEVREVYKFSRAEGTTTSELRERLRHVAAEFVSPESATEVNVDGSSRQDALRSIQAALEADGGGGSWLSGGGESPGAWDLAVAATDALVELARELHTVIFDGLWPRFFASDEFTVMMNTEEMRTVGFTDLDGKLIVSALPPQHPGAAAGGGKSSTANKRQQLSSRLASSLRAARLVPGGGGGGAGKDPAAAAPAAEAAGGPENAPPLSKAAPPEAARSHRSSSGGSSSGSGGRSLDIVEAATAAAAVAAAIKAAVTPAAERPPLGRRGCSGCSSSRPADGSFSRPARILHSSMDLNSSGVDDEAEGKHHVLGLRGMAARWADRARRRDAGGGGCGGLGASESGCAGRAGFVGGFRPLPASPASPISIGLGDRRSARFAAPPVAERRSWSLR